MEAILRHKGKGARHLYLVMWKGFPITEASWEPESHLRNAPPILEDYLRRVGVEDQHQRRNRGNRKKGWWWLWEYEATGEFAIEGPVLVGGLRAGGNHVRRAKPAWMVLKVVHWGRNHCDNSSLG